MVWDSRESDAFPVRKTEIHVGLPIGRTARLVFEIDAMRAECCEAAKELLKINPAGGPEFEECARLDDTLERAHRLLKENLRTIMLSRISRRSRSRSSRK
jgi:hypothetical protein